MTIRLRLLIICNLLSVLVSAQTEIHFSTGAYKEVSDTKTNYKRIYYLENDYVKLEDYYKDTLNLEAKLFNISTQEMSDDFIRYYRTNLANTHYKPEFSKIRAELSSYSEGILEYQMIYDGDALKYLKVFDSNQNQIIDSDGNGQFVDVRAYETNYKIFRDYVQTLNYGIRTESGDTIHYQLDKIASPKYGYPEFYRKMSSVIRYPLSSRISGQEGTFYVQFTVNEDGSLTDFDCKNSSVPKFEARTMKQLSKLKPWNPAELNGRTVKSCYVLPFIFKLND